MNGVLFDKDGRGTRKCKVDILGFLVEDRTDIECVGPEYLSHHVTIAVGEFRNEYLVAMSVFVVRSHEAETCCSTKNAQKKNKDYGSSRGAFCELWI